MKPNPCKWCGKEPLIEYWCGNMDCEHNAAMHDFDTWQKKNPLPERTRLKRKEIRKRLLDIRPYTIDNPKGTLKLIDRLIEDI